MDDGPIVSRRRRERAEQEGVLIKAKAGEVYSEPIAKFHRGHNPDPARSHFSARRLAAHQSPELLWIGCADSPVPANEIVGLLPGELLVHRNVLNIVVHTDLNASPFCSTLSRCCGCATSSFCGHYGCGGVRAALQGARLGLIDNWLRHVQDVRVRYDDLVMAAGDEEQRLNRLCELNVIEQAVRVCETTILQGAWSEGHPVSVHGWIYTLDDGRPRDLGSCVLDAEQVEAERVEAVARVAHART